MSEQAIDLAGYEKRLAGLSANLPQEFRQAAAEAAACLTAEQLRLWAEEGVALARQSLRSWEAASEYFLASPRVLPAVPFETVMRWVGLGRGLAADSSVIAAAYFRVGPECVGRLSPSQLEEWVSLGRRLHHGNWKSVSLASLFFSVSPQLLGAVGLPGIRRLGRLVERLAERSYELAESCLETAPRLFSELEPPVRRPFLALAEAIAKSGWADVRSYLDRAPGLLGHVAPDQRARFLRLTAGVAERIGQRAYQLFADAAVALGEAGPEAHTHLLSLAEELAVSSPAAAMAFLNSGPEVLARISVDDLSHWHAAGRRILEESEEGGEAYFRLESGKGERVLEALSSRLELSRVSEVLRLYCQALTGVGVSIHPTTTLTEKGIGWVSAERPSTEGTAVYLPEMVEEFESKGENFAIYKVYATHQAGHLEFGSFGFTFKRRGNIFPSRRRQRKSQRPRARGGRKEGAPLTDIERFFDLFPDRQLAADLFTIAEDARVDYLIKSEYGGIRRSWRLIQARELERRPRLPGLPLREAFLEDLVRASLDGLPTIVWARELMGTLIEAARLLRSLQQPQALVEDAAEVTLRLYDLAAALPNVAPVDLSDLDWQTLGDEEFELMLMKASGGGGEPSGMAQPGSPEEPYESPQPVEFRGDFKPELVQLLMRLRLQEGAKVPEGMAPLTAEQLRQLLEKSTEITVGAIAAGDLSSSLGFFLSNLEKEAGVPIPDEKVTVKDGQPVGDVAFEEKGVVEKTEIFYYDEWDFRAGDYKPRWCRVLQRPLEEGDEAYFEKTLRRHSALAAETRKQFEQLRPELFRRIKRLYDGEDFDLDLVIEYLTEKHSGHSFTDKVYWRRNKVERQVAVAFLLDMSASTDEEIEKRKQKYAEDIRDPGRYHSDLAQRKAQALLDPPKRIIDLEKESVVLLISALEAIGDDYGIYGFSGYGRDNVEFYVLKDLDEPLSHQVKARIDKTTPIRSTRMGPAVRHATAKLEKHDAKVRILFLVSDGRPQDHGYGRDRTEKEYAINDTHQALMEAKRKGIVPFCLTVDREGHEYLGQMCEEIDYEILGDIESLPSRLPTLYRRLTE